MEKTVINKVKKNLKHNFSQEEMIQLGSELAREYAAKTELEMRKKDVGTQLKAEIESHTLKAEAASRKLNNGYEYRDVECTEIIDTENKVCRLKRLDTGEEFTMPLTSDQMQTTILLTTVYPFD